jgi:hypothetical protein
VILRGHDGKVFSAAFNPGGTRVVTASGGNTADLWDAHLQMMPALLAAREGVQGFRHTLPRSPSADACRRFFGFFADLRRTAEQLTAVECWYRILSHALIKYLRGRQQRERCNQK